MPLSRIIAIGLIVSGILGLVYGGFDYTKATHEAELGPLHLSVDEKAYVGIPIWAGVAGIVIGALMLVFPLKR